MDISFIVILWVIISIAQAINDRKKAPPPPEIPPEFEIPTLKQSDVVEEIDISEIHQQKKDAVTKKIKPEKIKEENLEITPADAMNAIIMSEILDKPKALRRKKF